MTPVSDDGWYADPTGRHAERLYLSGVWTRRVRDAGGAESTEGEDHTGSTTLVRPPARTRDWSVERPSYGLVTAVAGALVAVAGFVLLDWGPALSFADARDLVDLDGGRFSVITQAYMRVLYLPLLLVTLATGLLAAVGRTMARVVVALAGVLGGVGLITAVVWIESGSVGTPASRGDALPVLVVMVGVGVVAAALGVGAYFDDRATLARGLAVTLAALAVVLHVFVIADLFSGGGESAFGAWAPAIGYALLAIAPVLPYRRILHAD